MSPKRNSLVKLVVIIKRKKGMSFEDFDKYWKEVHSPLVCGLPIFKEKIVKYNQVHLDLPRQQKSGVENGIPVCNDYDGFCELYAKSYQDLIDFFGNDIYKNIVGPDEAKFAERNECKTLFVYDEVHLDADDPSI